MAMWKVLGLAVLMMGCAAEQRSPEQGGWGDELADPTGQPTRTTEKMGEAGEASGDRDKPTPLTQGGAPTPAIEMRVRHDMMISKDTPREANCSCLMAIAAPPGDARVVFQNDAPKLEQDVLVFALSSKDVACPGVPEGTPRRPSIAGVEREGADVVVTVEELPPGRPLATGAVIALPGKGGGLYVKPKGAKVPYGRALSGGGGRCKVR